MPTRPLLPLLLLLSMTTNCTAFGPDGTVPMALHRDMVNRLNDCQMSTQEWMEKCGVENFYSQSRERRNLCPIECQPPREE